MGLSAACRGPHCRADSPARAPRPGRAGTCVQARYALEGLPTTRSFLCSTAHPFRYLGGLWKALARHSPNCIWGGQSFGTLYGPAWQNRQQAHHQTLQPLHEVSRMSLLDSWAQACLARFGCPPFSVHRARLLALAAAMIGMLPGPCLRATRCSTGAESPAQA